MALLISENKGAESRKENGADCSLIDTHQLKTPYEEIDTYTRGNKKIDFVLMTPTIQQSVIYVNIVQYNEFVVSDHGTLIVDIDYRVLEAGDFVFWQRPKRTFASISLINRRQFIEECLVKG